LFLGIVQGLTEFLPVSSSGHLVLAQVFLGVKEPPIVIDSFLHFGTLLAVLVYFASDLKKMVLAAAHFVSSWRNKDPYLWLVIYIAVGSIPAAIVGVGFESLFERMFSSVSVVGVMLIITGIILWLADIQKSKNRLVGNLSLADGIWIGIAQALAIIPGLSRSGTTIATGLFRGLEPKLAAKFSFLLSVPAIFGAALFSLRKALKISLGASLNNIFLSMVIAFIVGMFSLALIIQVTKERRLKWFSWYCFLVGIASLLAYYV
jgi:undecaprenyl-diphosphatase